MIQRSRSGAVEVRIGRRRVLELAPIPVAALGVAALGQGAAGCAAIIGEEEVDAYFKLAPDANGNFFGWSEITVSGADPEEDDAILLQALLEAYDPAEDLTFIESIVAEAVTPEERTPLAQGGDFPSGETIVPLDLIHDGGIGQFFQPAGDGDNKIRIEWTGKANPDHVFPEGGYRVNVRIKVEVV